MRPLVDAPELPEGYVPEGAQTHFLPWSEVEVRLRESVNYWLATTRPDGRPHVVPRWGVWHDGAFWYDGSPDTRHAVNVRHNPVCALHLESGSEVTILYGLSEASAPVAADGLGQVLAAEFARKYEMLGYAPEADAWSDEIAGGLRRIEPESAIAWSDFPTDLTRFRFDGGP